MTTTDLHTLIKERKTDKILSDSQLQIAPDHQEKFDTIVRECVVTSGMAPFHYPSSKEIPEPWRAYLLWNQQTNEIADMLTQEWKIESKEPQLANACSALILVTWVSEKSEGDNAEMKEVEHIAAASAYIQNLLLMLTSYQIKNYWSSGGLFRGEKMFEHLKIPKGEKLLGAIFAQYPDSECPDQVVKTGSLRELRTTDWIQER